jgi:hypothetical protein
MNRILLLIEYYYFSFIHSISLSHIIRFYSILFFLFFFSLIIIYFSLSCVYTLFFFSLTSLTHIPNSFYPKTVFPNPFLSYFSSLIQHILSITKLSLQIYISLNNNNFNISVSVLHFAFHFF